MNCDHELLIEAIARLEAIALTSEAARMALADLLVRYHRELALHRLGVSVHGGAA